jgi:hypothetical protein
MALKGKAEREDGRRLAAFRRNRDHTTFDSGRDQAGTQ